MEKKLTRCCSVFILLIYKLTSESKIIKKNRSREPQINKVNTEQQRKTSCTVFLVALFLLSSFENPEKGYFKKRKKEINYQSKLKARELCWLTCGTTSYQYLSIVQDGGHVKFSTFDISLAFIS